MSAPGPRYRDRDVLEETARPGRRLLVLAVGAESYFLRRIGPEPGESAEPMESAWAFAGCEAATRLVAPGTSDVAPRAGAGQ